jgi:hypothetical protein
MAGDVARLPSSSRDDDGGMPPVDLYRIAVEEYRFQAQYNWSRTQYLLAFNAGILAVAIGLGTQPALLSVLAFLLGLVAAVLTILVVKVQHGYYRAARDHMRRMEQQLGLDQEQRLDTTSTMGGRRRLVSVNHVVYLLLGAVAVANLYGAVARLAAAG